MSAGINLNTNQVRFMILRIHHKDELGRLSAQTDKRVHETSRLMPLRYKYDRN
jgi:hypothetical protein